VEKGGAAAGPLAGAHVHHHGERAAAERPGGGAVNLVLRAVASTLSL
jgi:hypothetical protein